MGKQVFMVMLEVPSPSNDYFRVKVDAESLALIIRKAIQSKSPSFALPTPFRIMVREGDELVSASGEIGRHRPELLDSIPDEWVTNHAS